MSRTFSVPLCRLRRSVTKALLILPVLLWLGTQAFAEVDPEESRAHFDKAAKFVEAGKFRAAVIELKNSLQEDPANVGARLLLANVYLLLGDGKSAEDQLKVAERYGMNPDQVAVPLGHALLAQGRFTEILSEFDPEGREPGIAIELRHLRAEAQVGLGQLSEARAAYEDMRKGNADDARAQLGLARIDLAERKYDDADAHAVSALFLNSDLPEAVLLRAEVRRQKREPESALPFYRAVLDNQQVPIAIRARAQLGLAAALVGLGRDAEAEAELTALRSVAPNAPLAAYLTAVIKVRANNFPAARDVLEESALALEEFAPAQYLFGIVYFAVGELETARSWLSRHVESHPRNLTARKLLGATLLRLNAIPEAIAALQPGLEQARDDPQILLLLGNAKLRNGHAAESAELLKRAAEFAPKEPRVLGQLAISQIATGQNEEALATLETTLDLGADASAIGYALAFSNLRHGEFEAALKMAQNLPDSAVVANLEGAAYAALGRPDDARRAFEAALTLEPDFHEARANLASLKARAGDLAGAEADYRQILDSDGQNVAALMGLAAVEHRRGNTAASRGWLEKAVAANPKAIDPTIELAENHLAAGDAQKAIDLVQPLRRQYPTNTQVLLTLAQLQERAGRYADAVGTYERLVEASGGAVGARLLLAQGQLAAGETKAARRVLEDSLTEHPEHRPTAEALVNLVGTSDGPEASAAYAERLQQKFPNAPWSSQLLGDLHWRAGRLEAALAAYEKAWATAPSAGMAVALARARSEKDATAALAPLRQWLEAHPSDDAVRMELGKSQLALGDFAGARETYEALGATQADNAMVWNNLAWLYQQLGDARAAELGERALKLAPNKPEVMDTLAWILLDGDETERAVTLLQEANQAAPDNPDIAFHYAVALHRRGDDAAARKVLESLLQGSKSFSAMGEAKSLLQELAR